MIKDQSKLHSCFGCRAFYSEIHRFGLDVEDVCQDVVKKYSSQSIQLELRQLVPKSAGGWAMGMDFGGGMNKFKGGDGCGRKLEIKKARTSPAER
jgi:hypothetical protein